MAAVGSLTTGFNFDTSTGFGWTVVGSLLASSSSPSLVSGREPTSFRLASLGGKTVHSPACGF